MKTIYLLFVVLTNSEGYETMTPISNIKHNSMLDCKIEKVQHKDVKNRIEFLCGDETKFFNKKQKFY